MMHPYAVHPLPATVAGVFLAVLVLLAVSGYGTREPRDEAPADAPLPGARPRALCIRAGDWVAALLTLAWPDSHRGCHRDTGHRGYEGREWEVRYLGPDPDAPTLPIRIRKP